MTYLHALILYSLGAYVYRSYLTSETEKEWLRTVEANIFLWQKSLPLTADGILAQAMGPILKANLAELGQKRAFLRLGLGRKGRSRGLIQ